MGTRGILGFVVDGKELITYNHFDSYPEGLGSTVIDFLRITNLETLPPLVRRLTVVNEDDKPTPKQAEELTEYTDGRVSTGSDWYATLRNTQGNPAAMLESGYVIDSHDFPSDSLFCEYGYVINLDDGVLEFYRGFVTEPHDAGRFASRVEKPSHRESKYYPIKLLGTWPFHDLPTWEHMDKLVAQDRGLGDDDD